MFTALAKHGKMSLNLSCKGDLHIDDHHTAEDCALALGEAFKKALGERRGIARYGYAYAPLDEVRSSYDPADLSRSPAPSSTFPPAPSSNATYRLPVKRLEIVSGSVIPLTAVSTEMIPHLLQSFAFAAGITLHVDYIRGTNNHHM